ncbi:hypothetical protein RvY_08509 [Ramazzottius varieornatus]|uniref:Uncharacterized protein n=1 Tax=Ramazzottius varieornatus TaxID=947166 RepID=A0A1D1VAP4_RAMVA|nr:hypothetical protein RvY_08509 [Ramazzottius varieornatus]
MFFMRLPGSSGEFCRYFSNLYCAGSMMNHATGFRDQSLFFGGAYRTSEFFKRPRKRAG